MDENTSFDQTKRQTINPLMDEINKQIEPLLKVAMNEFGYSLPLTFRLYNQIRFYEEFGKLHLGVSVASRKTLADQFGVTELQIDRAFNNLTTKYKLGRWVEHNQPVFRNVKRTWVSTTRYEKGLNNYYVVVPELLHGSTSTTTLEYLASEVPPLSESKKKVRESKALSKDNGLKAGNDDINSLFDYWEEKTGIPISARVKQNRFACSNLLKKHGADNLKRLVDGVTIAQSEKYAPSISDFADLQQKLSALLVWGKKQTNRRTIEL